MHNEELHNYCPSPNRIRMIELRWISWTGHVERMGRRRMRAGFLWESQKEREH
jgi:hypothetical protein